MATKTIPVFVNPLQLLEVDEPWKSMLKKDPQYEDLFKFLCTPGVSPFLPDLIERYKEISQEKPRLFVAPADQNMLEKVVWPLRNAKASYFVGNYLSTVALCGVVAEMMAIFLYEVAQIEGKAIKTKKGYKLNSEWFEKKSQERRVEALSTNNIIDRSIALKFDTIREIRRKYLHRWSVDHSKI